jgi:predicted nucleic acid-binding Zn ribbon protein
VRRLAPRLLSHALEGVIGEVEPATALARAQASWDEVAGPAVAGSTAPVAERDGVLTVACESAVWAQELDLLGPDLLHRLNEAVGARAHGAGGFARLRFVVRSAPN